MHAVGECGSCIERGPLAWHSEWSIRGTPGRCSANGRYVAFVSDAQDLVSGLNIVPGINNVYRYDRVTKEVVLVSINAAGDGGGNEDSGAYTFPGSSRQMWPSISADGNIIAFGSRANNLHSNDTRRGSDVYARDLNANRTYLVTVNESGAAIGYNDQQAPLVSGNGRVIVWRSGNDILAYDLTSGQRDLISVNQFGTGGANAACYYSVVSDDGTVVAFTSDASNLHQLDTNERQDVYARNRVTGVTYLVSINDSGTNGGDSGSALPRISADGNTILFLSDARES